MQVYLINSETNELIRTFNNVKSWNENFVIYDNNGYLGKIYCGSNEYFTDIEPIVDDQELIEE